VRAFRDDNVTHVDNEHSPQKDIDVINTELVLADLQTVEKRLPRLEKETRANPKLKPELDTMQKAYQLLNNNVPLWTDPDINEKHIADLFLITSKRVIYVFNVDEDTISDSSVKTNFQQLVAPTNSIFICAKLENELRELSSEDRVELLESYGQTESGLVQLIHAAYDTLGLQTYLTAGEKEVRAWTINKGSTAPQAAGVIHGDFEKGFIAAQIVDYTDLIQAGSEMAAKASGKIRTEGKDYIMQPDDVVEFRFNVTK
jgi:GTP-binding protein YchF